MNHDREERIVNCSPRTISLYVFDVRFAWTYDHVVREKHDDNLRLHPKSCTVRNTGLLGPSAPCRRVKKTNINVSCAGIFDIHFGLLLYSNKHWCSERRRQFWDTCKKKSTIVSTMTATLGTLYERRIPWQFEDLVRFTCCLFLASPNPQLTA